MKSTINLIALIMLIALSISCKTQQVKTKNAISKGNNSMTSVDFPGTYQAILPCADCKGIKTQIILNNDSSYKLQTQYMGKDEKIFEITGNFKWDVNGSKIILDNTDKQIFKVGENKLLFLTKEGITVNGDLAGKYILEKEKIEITGKYWKLVRLNGKAVKVENREPFITFDIEGNHVAGNTGCNSFNGNYELSDGNTINFSQFALTKMACLDSNLEDDFLQVVEKTKRYSITLNELIFQDEYEKTIAKFESDYFK